jgi:hypothetical protein
VIRDEQQLCPSNESSLSPIRIAQGIFKVIPYWKQVFDSKGANVNTNTNGHQGNEARAEGSQAGGKRTKMTFEQMNKYWLHPDAREAMNTFEADSKINFKKILAQVKKENGTVSQPKGDCYNTESIDVVPQKELPEEDALKDPDGDDSKEENDQL